MKNLAIDGPPFSAGSRRWRRLRQLRLRGVHFHSRFDLLQAVEDDFLSGLDPAFDHPELAETLARADRPDLDLVARAHDVDLTDALQFGDRALRHQERTLHRLNGGTHPAELAT